RSSTSSSKADRAVDDDVELRGVLQRDVVEDEVGPRGHLDQARGGEVAVVHVLEVPPAAGAAGDDLAAAPIDRPRAVDAGAGRAGDADERLARAVAGVVAGALA